MTDTRLITG